MMDEPFKIRSFDQDDEESVVALWSITFPDDPSWNESRALIRQKQTTQPELFFVCCHGDRLIGTAIAGYDGVRGWVHKVASHPDYRGRGVARLLMKHVELQLAARGCVKLNLQVRAQNEAALGFYEKIGFEREERVSFGKRIDK